MVIDKELKVHIFTTICEESIKFLKLTNFSSFSALTNFTYDSIIKKEENLPRLVLRLQISVVHELKLIYGFNEMTCSLYFFEFFEKRRWMDYEEIARYLIETKQ
jgi:hypothetical protein